MVSNGHCVPVEQHTDVSQTFCLSAESGLIVTMIMKTRKSTKTAVCSWTSYGWSSEWKIGAVIFSPFKLQFECFISIYLKRNMGERVRYCLHKRWTFLV